MARPKKPIDPSKTYLTDTQKAQQRNKAQIGIRMAPEVIERLRNYTWATQIEGGINGIVEEATVQALERLEAAYQRTHKKPVPTRPNAGGK